MLGKNKKSNTDASAVEFNHRIPWPFLFNKRWDAIAAREPYRDLEGKIVEASKEYGEDIGSNDLKTQV